MADFYLPYQFVPVTGKVNDSDVLTWGYDYDPHSTTSVMEPLASEVARHDLWPDNRRSGRIICQMKMTTPTGVGNIHNQGDEGKPTVVTPYTYRGKVAIPGNSIRGMIASIVETISQSSLRVLDPLYWNCFSDIHDDMPPWNPRRSRMTPAEMLFGVVDDQSGAKREVFSRNLASRVRVFDGFGVPDNPPLLNPQILAVLGEPKPVEIPDGHKDSPSNYFRSADGNVVTKWGLKGEITAGQSSERPKPNGRKYYLTHRAGKYANYILQDQRKKGQSMQCRLIPANSIFFFHLDFEGLTDAEFGLLMTALHPDQYFRHRIGLGKSLGLGAVKVDPQIVVLRDLRARYGPKLKMNSPQTCIIDQGWEADADADAPWHNDERYWLEADSLNQGNPETTIELDDSLVDTKSLAFVKKISGIEAQNRLRKNVEIRWRKGHKKSKPPKQDEPACPLPPIALDKELPIYGEKIVMQATQSGAVAIGESTGHTWLQENTKDVVITDRGEFHIAINNHAKTLNNNSLSVFIDAVIRMFLNQTGELPNVCMNNKTAKKFFDHCRRANIRMAAYSLENGQIQVEQDD